MGYLTPILIRNDDANELLNNKMQKQICEKIYNATCDRHPQSIAFNYPKGGVACNAIESLGNAHADEQRVIVKWIMKNCLVCFRNMKIYLNKQRKNLHFNTTLILIGLMIG